MNTMHISLCVAALLFVQCASAEYRLNFLSSIQVGQWDKDAAENVAFDAKTARAFVASAEEGSVKVINLADPTKPVRAGTLEVKGNMLDKCDAQHCFYHDYDFGGGSAPCGYAPMVNIIFEKGDCAVCATNRSARCKAADCVYTSNPSHNAGKLAVDASVATWEGCQKACQADAKCEFFSWETEVWPAGDAKKFGGAAALVDGMHRVASCFLKSGFAGQTRDGTQKCQCADRECNGYVHWEAHKSTTARGTHCAGMTSTTCVFEGAKWNANDNDCEIAADADLACVAAKGTVRSSDWINGVPRNAYGFAIGNHFSHVYDRDWYAGSGPKFCEKFLAESVQSVAVTTVPGYKNSIVVTASPHAKPFANGMLAYFDAETYEYLGCAPAGNKPEGIASTGTGKIACINEGTASDDFIDNEGSMTMCDASAPTPQTVSLKCVTYPIDKANFKAGAWKHAPEFRLDGVRLYGPNGNNVTHDVEPEGGAFTEDGKYFFTVLQDNSAYTVFDIEAKKYITMKGLGVRANAALDFSDRDNKMNIHPTASHTILMPDQVAHFMKDGKYYFITANEGGTRSADMIGMSGDFEGEEIRMKDLPCTVPDMCKDGEFGRLITTAFMPSDYAINACGNNNCDAEQLNGGLDKASSGIRHDVKGAGKFMCIYRDADYGGCSSVCNLHTEHEMWHDPSGCSGSNYPDRVGFYVDSVAPNNYTSDYKLPTYSTAAMDKNGALAIGVRPDLREDPHSPNPLGYDSSVVCQKLCDDVPSCDHWYLEFELNRTECYLKKALSDPNCHEYSFKTDKYDYATRNFHDDYKGKKTFVAEGYASWGGPRSDKCISPAPYTNVANAASPAGPGTPGGTISPGGRSFSIFEMKPDTGDISLVFDSGSIMETMQRDMIPFGLCTGCDGDSGNNAAGRKCAEVCPFNADKAPANFDTRSDNKGPEPECVTTGVMSDGVRLSFVGLERTGGVLTYDISDPAKPVFQDLFNVRNWMVDKAGTRLGDADLLDFALNDGPETLVFVPAAESPIGKELLIAATPLAGRVTTYVIEKGAKRTDDGSCRDTATCPYLEKSKGGTAAELEKDVCLFAVGGTRKALGCADESDDDELPVAVIAGVVIAVVVAVLGIIATCVLISRERAGKPMFTALKDMDGNNKA